MAFGKLGAMGRGMGHLGALGSSRVPWAGLPGTVYYVSKSTDNGFAVGSDSNSAAQAQSKATPWATISKAVSTAANGDIIVINDGTYSGTELGATNFVSLAAKLLNFFAFRSGNVTISSSAGAVTGLIRINNVPATSGVTFYGLIFDGASLSTPVFCDNASANTPTITFTNCTWQNPLNFANSFTATKAVLTYNNAQFAGTNRAFISWQTMAATSALTFNGGNISQSSRTTANDGLINVKATASGTSLTINGLTGSGTINSGVASGVFDIIRCFDVSTVQITNSNLSLLGHPGTAIGAVIRATPDTTIAMAVTVAGNTINNESTGGYGILVGADATGAGNNQANNCVIEGNIVTATRANQQATTPVHGIIVGWSQGGTIRRNKVSGCGHGIISKANTTTTAYVYSNIIVDSEFEHLYAKGSADVIFSNNTLYATSATTANTIAMARLAVGDDGSTGSSSVTVENNILYAANAAALKVFELTDSFSSGTYNNNNYFLASGALPANCFSYQGTTYSTVAAWAAAQEATAISGDPVLVDPANGNFNLGTGSAAKWAGVAVANVTVDYNGTAWHSPPSVGALEAA
jgi:hypothetical protein